MCVGLKVLIAYTGQWVLHLSDLIDFRWIIKVFFKFNYSMAQILLQNSEHNPSLCTIPVCFLLFLRRVLAVMATWVQAKWWTRADYVEVTTQPAGWCPGSSSTAWWRWDITRLWRSQRVLPRSMSQRWSRAEITWVCGSGTLYRVSFFNNLHAEKAQLNRLALLD